MGTSIDCHSCGSPLSGDQSFCGTCGTPVLQGRRPAPATPPSDAAPRGAGLSRVRVPWSLGLLGVLATGSFFFGGGRSADDVAGARYPDAAVAIERPELDAPSNDSPETSSTEGKNAAAARLALEEELGRADEAAESLAVEEEEAESLAIEELRAQEDSARRAEIAELVQLRQEANEAQAAAERAAQATASARTEENGVLRLIVLPFADVYVQGALQVRATSRFELSLPPGTYALRLVNENRATVDTTFVINPGEPTGVRATLPPRNR